MATDGELIYICGSSRNGKTAFTKHLISGYNRVIVWDIEAEFCQLPGFTRARTLTELLNAVTANGGTGPAKIAYTGQLADYDQFCKVAFAWGNRAPCAVVLEETSDVTKPNWCPEWHGQLIRKGLKRGITIIAITQRPAESDKTAIGNATKMYCFYLSRAADRDYMARELNVDRADIEALPKLAFIKKDVIERRITSGLLKFQ